jgi:hypothetical protein
MKVDAKCALAVATPRSGLVSTTNFHRYEWQIMYPLFIEEGLVGPSECVNRKDV